MQQSINNSKSEFEVPNIVGSSLTDYVISTIACFVIMAVFCCICCLCMKYNDRKLKGYILETAKRKGYKVDLDQLNPKRTCPSPLANENCTIIVPEVGIIL